jgi:hypothetical protein
MDEERELSGVAKEEDRGVVVNPIPVTLIRVHLDGEAPWVSGSVWGTLLTTDSRETGNAGGLLADGAQHVNGANIGDVMGAFKLPISSCTLCMDDTLWDTLTIEMCQQIDQVKVLKQERASLTNSLKSLWVLYWTSIGSRVRWLLIVLEGRRWLIVGDHDCG